MLLKTFTRGLFRRNRALKLDPIDVAVCIDIECTCDTPVQMQPMEIIEIACLKLDLIGRQNQTRSFNKDKTIPSNLDKCPTFHSFVRPVINPKLTLFCQELTGVLQTTVDKAETIEVVIDNLFKWLQDEELIDKDNMRTRQFAFASCGNFDLNLLSPLVSSHKFNNDLELPIYFREWINVKKTFVNHKRGWPKGLYHMLELLGEEPSGRLHSAVDDCKNLARVIECLYADGCKFHITSKL
jgi:inhibitor of KinA sporulation pathway (predicted exonuclease)